MLCIFIPKRLKYHLNRSPVTSLSAYISIAQSVIVIFLAGSFLKRDKKLDTAEVIYVRPMSNADYIVGKVWVYPFSENFPLKKSQSPTGRHCKNKR